VEIAGCEREVIDYIKNLPGVSSVDYTDNILMIKSRRGSNNLVSIVDYLKTSNLEFSRIYSEIPTLNDVFLEITGKQLRDQPNHN
jgi:ABC-2 type transport system ATP-binding protein